MGQSSQRVVLARCPRYRVDSIQEFLGNSANFGVLRNSYHGCRVLLKPNLITSRGPAIACTDPRVIEAVGQWFLDRGARLAIGDSPAFGTAALVLRKRGAESMVKRLGLKVREFRTPVVKELSNGVRIGVAAEALETDLLVNLPKVKAHNQMFVTLAVKNLFGVVCGIRKGLAHLKNGHSHQRFAELMLDLAELFPESVSIADGIRAMHRDGPIGGRPLDWYCLGASSDPVALETALLEALELERSCSPIWAAAARRGLPGADPGRLEYPLESPAAFHGSGFVAPSLLNPVPFNPLRFLVSSCRRLLLGVTARVSGGHGSGQGPA